MKSTYIPPLALLFCLLLGACASSGGPPNSGGERQDAAKVNTELGTAYMQRGNFDLAKQKLNKALEYDPGYAPAHAVLGILYERIGESAQAGDYYRQALKLDPDSASVHNNYGRWLCSNGQAEAGLQHLQTAVEDPFYNNQLSAHTNAGLCALSLQDYQLAEDYLRKSLKMNPNSADALYAMADLSYKRNDFLRARAFLQRHEGVAGPRADSLLLGYRVESELGDQRAAAQYADRLRDRYPDSSEARALP